MKKIVLTGGTGFLGSYLSSKFKEDGYQVLIISRNDGDVVWKDREAIVNALNGADVVINIASKSGKCRYNEKTQTETT